MTELTTEDLRDRIEDAEARNAERSANAVPAHGANGAHAQHEDDGALAQASRTLSKAGNKIITYAKEHPALAIAGGVVLGLAVASMFKGPRRLAAKGSARAAGLAAIGSEMALAYALDAYEKAQEASREGARKFEDLTDNVADSARKARREANYRAGTASDKARIKARDTSKAMARKLGR